MIRTTFNFKSIIFFSYFLLLSLVLFGQDGNGVPFSGSAAGEFCNTDCEEPNCTNSFFRSIDGSCNNLSFTTWGAAGTLLNRISSPTYSDNDGSTMLSYGNPRDISNIVSNQTGFVFDERELSSMMYTWLQFLDHDITVVAAGEEAANIPVPLGDQYFDPFFTGDQTIEFNRSEPVVIDDVREFENEITSWIDASMVYGSDQDRANWLRSFEDGKLKVATSANGDLLPYNTITGEADSPIDLDAPRMDGDRDSDGNPRLVFVAGDIRAVEQPTLTAMHTLFVREHNRICDDLISKGFVGDNWIYEVARAKVIGIIQSITYYEVFPALGLPDFGPAFYQPTLDPSLSHEFSSAAYRLGHSMLPPIIPILEANCEDAVYYFRGTTASGELSLRDAFFNLEIVANNGIDAIIRGIASQTQQKIDHLVIDDVRNFLFGPTGAGGLDLASLNIQRGRDHGLADYNSIRESLGLERFTSFSQISSDVDVQNRLQTAYNNNINQIDAWVGMISEDLMPNSSIGETISTILYKEFQDLRNGDRLWFERNTILTGHIYEIKNTKLADVILRNTACENLNDVFFAKPCTATTPIPEEYCEGGGLDSSYEFLEEVYFYNNDQQSHFSGNDNGYADFTPTTFNFENNIYSIFRLVPNSLYGDPLHFKVWVDYNKDGDFDDAREWVYASYNINGPVNGFFYFPTDIAAGIYRMRIGMNFGNPYFEACESYQYGEMQDYLIAINTGNGIREEVELPTLEDLAPPNYIEDNISLFPNPTVDYLQVSMNNRGKETEAILTIINGLGQRIQIQNVSLRDGHNQVKIDLNKDVLPGIYYLTIQRSHQRTTTKKFIVSDQ